MATEYNDPRGKKAVLPVASIIADPRLQLRAKGSDPNHVADLREAIKAKKELPPIEVREVEGEGIYVTDGFHTLEATAAEGKKEIACALRKGTFTDAMLDAARANTEHNALKRTQLDRHNQVTRTLRTLAEAGIKWSHRRVAEHCLVSHGFVAKVAEELAQVDAAMRAAKESKTPAVGSDGKERAPKKQTKAKAEPHPDNAVPSLEGSWRQLPPNEAFDLSAHDARMIAKAGIVTVGSLFDALVGGGVPGVGGYTVEKLVGLIKNLSGFDGVIPEPKRDLYDWDGFEADVARVARRINEAANATGGQNEASDRMHEHWKAFHTLFLAWKADLIQRNEETSGGEEED